MENQSKEPEVNCEKIAAEVSAMHDDEPISPIAAEHIASCVSCQQRAREYAEMKTELRVSSLRSNFEPPQLPTLTAKRNPYRILSLLAGRTVLPRAIAALAALVIVALSVSLAVVVHAQVDGPWVHYSISLIVPQDHEQRETGVLQSPSMPRGSWVMRGPAQTVAYTIRTLEIRDQKAQLEIGLRGFPGDMDYDTAMELVKSTPTARYWCTPGQPLEIAVDGLGSLRISAHISANQPAVPRWDDRPIGENELRLDSPVVLRGKEVICEGAGGTAAAGVRNGGALHYYVPGEGLLIISLEQLPDGIEGTTDGSIMQFEEAAVKYRIFSRQAIAGGKQPRPIWVQRDPLFKPSTDADTPSLIASGRRTLK